MKAAEQNRADIVTKYGAYVRSLANTVRRQFGGRLNIEDLCAYGNIGLFEAWDRFDPKVGANFLTFAHYRIKGAIYDGLRKMGMLRGADHARSYINERATEYLRNASDRDTGGQRGRADDVRDVSDAVTALATVYATSFDAFESLSIRDDSLGAEDRLEKEQLKARVKAAVEKLPENERKLLAGYYYEDKTIEEAGRDMGLSKSWASRLHSRAVERLRDLLSEEFDLAGEPGDSRRQSHG